MPNSLEPLTDGLIPAATREKGSGGRRVPEPEHQYRGMYQRDRDRVIHSAHFRRLEYKTQVFVNGEGDNYRTRLTHTLEVTQVARSLARALHLNEDLAEAVALSHDLGHTPFGHAGERVMNSLLADSGGFNHNSQGLRIVDVIEQRYAAFAGLNLTYEVREAFVRHGGSAITAEHPEFSPDDQPLLEVAVTLLADDIAYLAHDIDDGLYSGFLNPEQLRDLALWRESTARVDFEAFPEGIKRTEGVRRLINALVTDAVETSKKNIFLLKLESPADVRAAGKNPVVFSTEIDEKKSALKAFLFHNFYRHPNVMEVMEEAGNKLRWLFAFYSGNPEKMPLEYRKIADSSGIKRAVADYISGMTDRYANEAWTALLRRDKSPKK